MILSIIIPVGKDPIGLTETLESYQQMPSSDKNGVEVIVVIDGPYDEVESVANRYHGVKALKLQKNGGSYHARNKGAERATGERLAFIDAGVEFKVDWLQKAINHSSEAEYLAGNVLHPSPKGGSVELYQLLFEFQIAEHFENLKFCPTANLIVTRKLFLESGGFEERLRSSGDREFGSRVLDAGTTASLDLARIVYHPFRSLKGLLKKKLRISMGYRNLSMLYPERFPPDRVVNLLKMAFPPKTYALLNPLTKWSRIHELEKEYNLHFNYAQQVSCYLLLYLTKLTVLWGRLIQYRSSDSFEWSNQKS
ncbi:glycosyltransferase [Luteolibacter pohnpeiensis]|uniref:Glycosyltransferase n=1 Tax=Luteolibacter pohnpeiensis TaxID=454153 RepID=A0A934S7R1_9BACT|nr:glycosyltransferase family A protein [Luteolibacter pohnpeiensis]MBK1882855.1 glycosyltransferase [Luteolibacter pohnpeiensis]